MVSVLEKRRRRLAAELELIVHECHRLRNEVGSISGSNPSKVAHEDAVNAEVSFADTLHPSQRNWQTKQSCLPHDTMLDLKEIFDEIKTKYVLAEAPHIESKGGALPRQITLGDDGSAHACKRYVINCGTRRLKFVAASSMISHNLCQELCEMFVLSQTLDRQYRLLYVANSGVYTDADPEAVPPSDSLSFFLSDSGPLRMSDCMVQAFKKLQNSKGEIHANRFVNQLRRANKKVSVEEYLQFFDSVSNDMSSITRSQFPIVWTYLQANPNLGIDVDEEEDTTVDADGSVLVEEVAMKSKIRKVCEKCSRGLEYFLNLTLFLGSILFIISLTPVWAPRETLSMARAFDPALDLLVSRGHNSTLRRVLTKDDICDWIDDRFSLVGSDASRELSIKDLIIPHGLSLRAETFVEKQNCFQIPTSKTYLSCIALDTDKRETKAFHPPQELEYYSHRSSARFSLSATLGESRNFTAWTKAVRNMTATLRREPQISNILALIEIFSPQIRTQQRLGIQFHFAPEQGLVETHTFQSVPLGDDSYIFSKSLLASETILTLWAIASLTKKCCVCSVPRSRRKILSNIDSHVLLACSVTLELALKVSLFGSDAAPSEVTRSALPSSMVPFDHYVYTTSASILATIGLTSLILSFVALQHAHQCRCLHQLRLSNIVSQMFPLGLLYLLSLIPYMLLGHYFLGDIFPSFRTASTAFAATVTMTLGNIDHDLLRHGLSWVPLYLISFHFLSILLLGKLFAIVLKHGQVGISLDDDDDSAEAEQRDFKSGKDS